MTPLSVIHIFSKNPSFLLFVLLHVTRCCSEVQLSLHNSSLNVLSKVRWSRSVGGLPEPVECVFSEWSEWTRCDPCQKKRYRYTKLQQPSQFGGEPCHFRGREEEACAPPSRYSCRDSVQCDGFVCTTTGRCIPQRLVCNGDDDCGDRSDEKSCKKVYKPCKTKVEEYWGIENLGKGINILNSNLEGVVIDNRYYGGSCLPQYIYNTRFRKPFNLQHYTLETKGNYEFSLDAYESYSSYEKDTFKAHSSQKSVSFGISLPGIFEFGFNYQDAKFKKNVQKTRRLSGTKSSFVRAHSRLEVAQYKLKTQDLMLHYEFFQRLQSLPMEYSYGEYKEIFKDYGTHYITEATLGGDYEYTVVLNQESMERTDFTLSDANKCVQAGLKVGANIDGLYVSLGAGGGRCRGLLKELGDSKTEKRFVEDFIVEVKGGASEYITRLAYNQLPTPALMQEWGEAVQYNPDFIESKTEPLFELVTSKDFANANIIKRNLKRALEEYLAESSNCRCAPCLNNGVAVLKDTRCECVCPMGFRGRACEITQRTGMNQRGWDGMKGGVLEKMYSREQQQASTVFIKEKSVVQSELLVNVCLTTPLHMFISDYFYTKFNVFAYSYIPCVKLIASGPHSAHHPF
ncbi:complement component C8 beta chain isoform X1 [Lepisosteus oculatus]|uniref:complement component C8 beta chain isoform X1 n=1 Tax=Lepisosteus oculatus TaxID=7918 RepID=UPI003712184C